MWETLFNFLQSNGMTLVTLGGKINPVLGAILASILTVVLLFLGYKAKKEMWDNAIHNSGENIGTTTGENQNTADDVLHGTDDWLDGKK